jgi:cation diffusion facilitator CzcD-associated flavoprotein CzcO
MYDVVILGAGPFGLSAAAHLKQIKGLDMLVFGEPMSFWERHMPARMLLRSWRPASHIADPGNRLSLDVYGSSNGNQGLPEPLPVRDFIKYGHWFHQQAGVATDGRKIARVEPSQKGYQVTLEDGEMLRTRRVVVATGIQPFTHRPKTFEGLPASLVTHSSEHQEYERFRDKEVLVIGGGQSSLESATFLREAGAHVEILIRSRSVASRAERAWQLEASSEEVNSQDSNAVLNWLKNRQWMRMLYGGGDVGPAGFSLLIQRPNLFRRLPRRTKDWSDRRAIRPMFSYRHVPVTNAVPCHACRFVIRARVEGDRLHVRLNDGTERIVDHVVLATGYRVNVALYSFLSPRILEQLDVVDGYPRLDSGLESSLAGLHFLGAPAAWTFGPLVRFVAGTEFTSQALTRRILRTKKC